jgi:hypothetical protein
VYDANESNESYGYNPAWLKPVASSHTTAVDPPVDIDRGGWKGGRHPHLTYGVRRQNPDLKSSAILADEFHHKAELAKYGRVLVLLDACHSGGFTIDGSALTSNADLLRFNHRSQQRDGADVSHLLARSSEVRPKRRPCRPYRARRIPRTDHPHPDDVGSLDAPIPTPRAN